jgi:hypothetical protein
VLDQVLRLTDPLQLPVLLLLGIDPDIQQAIASAPSAVRDEPDLAPPIVAGFMADRDYPRALEVVRRMDESCPLLDCSTTSNPSHTNTR